MTDVRGKERGVELVEKNIRTYMTLLRGSVDIHLESFIEAHLEMEPTLHPRAESRDVDITAFLYAAIRLPDCIHAVRRIVLGQSEEAFKTAGVGDVFHWREVTASARRRHTLYDGRHTLAVFITSTSDIDDIVPSLVVFQMEWNKMHACLADHPLGKDLAAGKIQAASRDEDLRKTLNIDAEDWRLLHKGWGNVWEEKIRSLATGRKEFRLTLIRGGFSDYRRLVQQWWTDLARRFEESLLEFRPIYLTSSNMYGFSNLLGGFANRYEKEIKTFALDRPIDGFERRWRQCEGDGDEQGMTDLLYYAAREMISEAASPLAGAYRLMEAEAGISAFEERQALDLPAQIIDIRKIIPERLDARLRLKKADILKDSRAMIVNIEYPLGFASYHVFSQIVSSVRKILGVYIMGKAATMSARLGDVMIPNEIYDAHSRNHFYFKNCFSLKDFNDLVRNVAVLDRQKALTVKGTFLQNREMMQEYHKSHFNSVEMEAGPYLCAIYENIFPDRYPMNTALNLLNDAEEMYDVGLLYFASDTPYHRRESLLSRSMGIAGIESVYACTSAILRRIFYREIHRIMEGE